MYMCADLQDKYKNMGKGSEIQRGLVQIGF